MNCVAVGGLWRVVWDDWEGCSVYEAGQEAFQGQRGWGEVHGKRVIVGFGRVVLEGAGRRDGIIWIMGRWD